LYLNRIRSKKKSRVDDFEYFTEFQSHEPGFDYLKSAEIEEKVNSIEWINNKSSSLQMLSANDKNIKLWRLYYNKKKKYQSWEKLSSKSGDVVFPKSEVVEEDWDAMCRKEFSNAHNYHINSVSLSADGEHFLSADDLRVNIWNIENTKTTFSIVDIKPPNIDDLNEVITHAEFHPTKSDLFLFSSSKGCAHLCDARENTQFEKCATKFEITIDPAKKHFFSEIISSISSATFLPGKEDYFCTRDYLTVKIWDIRNNAKYVKSINITDYVEKKLWDLYENESVFDKFEVNASPCGNYLLTGSYNNNGHVIDIEGGSNSTVDAVFGNKRGKVSSKIRQYNGKKLPSLGDGSPDLKKKALLNAYHPTENIIAVANHNCIFIFNQEKKLKH